MARVNYDVNVGMNCNASCHFCNRLIDLFRIPNSQMTVEQIASVIEQWKEHGVVVKKLKISGGEPSLNPNLVQICQMFLESGIVEVLWVLTNGIKDNLPSLPRGARYKKDPIIEGTDYQKNHQPFLISPDDLGIRSENCGTSCSTMRNCGRGVDAFGFTFCGIAGALGHVLGIDPYSDEPVLRPPSDEICKHCLYSLDDEEQKRLQRKAPISRWPDGTVHYGAGVEYPTHTFREALEKYKKEPTRYPRRLEQSHVGQES